MAAVAPPADQASDLLQKLSLDSQTKTFGVPDASEKASVDSNKVPNGIQSDRSVTPILSEFMDPPVCYLPSSYTSTGYYYGGYDGSVNDWEEYTKYMTSDGSDIALGVYGDNRSLMYHGYGYTPYGPYSPAASPVPNVGHDQLYGAHLYQYPTPYFHSLARWGSYPSMSTLEKGDIAAAADQAPLSMDSTNSKSNSISNSGSTKVNNGVKPVRETRGNTLFDVDGLYGRGPPGGFPASGFQDPWFGYDGLQSPFPCLESLHSSHGQLRPVSSSSMTPSIANGNGGPVSRSHLSHPNQMGSRNPRSFSGMNTSYAYMNRLYPTKYGNSYRTGMGHGSNVYDSRTYGPDWIAVDGKYKPRERANGLYGYANESMDGLNELNRGPRAKSSKNQKSFTPAALIIKGQNIPLTGSTDCEKEKLSTAPDREQYNLTDFPETYANAKFFIIKSYSEDDIHKSIKYNVWSSTPNGNKKLNDAYLDAQPKSGGCPVFFFFSVNTSGQFVGVAEMAGPVDFNKNVDYWQQDKWIGCFPVKWHIVKDVPNSLLKHITLENNENKPVTNSRDTQEVKLELGLQMLKIFKDHTSKQCILDDFDFYDDRQKRIQMKKAKQLQFQKQVQVWDGKSKDEKIKESTYGDIILDKSLEVVSDSEKQANAYMIDDSKKAMPESGDSLKSIKLATAIAEKPVVKEDANCC